MRSINLTKKRINWCGLIVLSTALLPCPGYAQEQVALKGRVEGQNGKPLSGVTIYSKTTAKGAVTGNDGEFTIPSAAADTLTFSFIGYDTQKVGVGGRSNLVIKLI